MRGLREPPPRRAAWGGGSGRGPAPEPSINAPGRPAPRVLSTVSSGRPDVGAARGRFAATPGSRRARSRSHAVLAHAARALQPAQLRQLPAVRAAPPRLYGRSPRGAAGVGGRGAVGRPGAGREPQGPGSRAPSPRPGLPAVRPLGTGRDVAKVPPRDGRTPAGPVLPRRPWRTRSAHLLAAAAQSGRLPRLSFPRSRGKREETSCRQSGARRGEVWSPALCPSLPGSFSEPRALSSHLGPRGE